MVFVSNVEFVVFGKFAGFDAVLGQDCLRQHQCVLEMGTGRVIIKRASYRCTNIRILASISSAMRWTHVMFSHQIRGN